MVFVTGLYGTVVAGYHEILRGVTVMVVHQTPRGLHQAPYNGVSFLARDYRDEAVQYTWKDVASETTTR